MKCASKSRFRKYPLFTCDKNNKHSMGQIQVISSNIFLRVFTLSIVTLNFFKESAKCIYKISCASINHTNKTRVVLNLAHTV